MAPSLRTISILMLLAGVSMGVFAGTLMADDPVPQSGIPKAGVAANQRALHYQRIYGLDEVQTDAIRQVLVQHERAVRDQLRTLWSENQHRFDQLTGETQQRIRTVLVESGVAPEDD